MKKIVMAILVMAAISVSAQDHNMKGKRGDMKDLSPEQVATLQTKKMTLALDLNESQQAKVKTILTKDATARKAKMADRKASKEDGKKVLTSEEKYAKQNERLDYQIARKKEMKSILTADQFNKWEKMSHRKKMRGHGKDKGDKKGKRSSKE
ncbi:hypothetical protein QSV08_19945 [Maribacter sp. BPC-D8]|uniref:hypothetical protein n=1 Tax=Maribacter sp. BPC-D8 TaxID=3053613 RepID=UPI002B4A3B1F|nr:hypothetical protein [Maribacter sp. BPC-D8]WRI29481.1 hypothetical protein QSV08_19945 [Maribacter sp. BPC-D8]